jgi:hypothetical protein
MEKIVKFNNIKLPQLPPGQTYFYDPETNQLMVRRPKPNGAVPPGSAPQGETATP